MEFDVSKYEYKVEGGKLIATENKRAETKEEWVDRMYDAYSKESNISSVFQGRWTYVSDDKGNIGKTCCDKDDEYNIYTGVAVAYAKMKGLPIHKDVLRGEKEVSTRNGFKLGETVKFKYNHHIYFVKIAGFFGKFKEACLIKGYPHGHDGSVMEYDIVAGKWEPHQCDYYYAVFDQLSHL